MSDHDRNGRQQEYAYKLRERYSNLARKERVQRGRRDQEIACCNGDLSQYHFWAR